jgi:hypothetical protein
MDKPSKQRKKELKQEYFDRPRPAPTEDELLENNSYWDIDYLEEVNKPIHDKIEEWQDRYKNASSNMGKWYCQIQIDRYKNKLHKYVNK